MTNKETSCRYLESWLVKEGFKEGLPHRQIEHVERCTICSKIARKWSHGIYERRLAEYNARSWFMKWLIRWWMGEPQKSALLLLGRSEFISVPPSRVIDFLKVRVAGLESFGENVLLRDVIIRGEWFESRWEYPLRPPSNQVITFPAVCLEHRLASLLDFGKDISQEVVLTFEAGGTSWTGRAVFTFRAQSS